ncbi:MULTISPECIES: serine hydrolase [unclassified Rhodococcus (in: high G+C Gram-positive bacteria)]|uniref:serine hydrolase n=1 Tax=unclassified Rhodococcus (in: high G+C Gram-positive bacteria) TaxID=192944 RepID=UPI000AF7F0E9|nr:MULTISPECIES: serine hydrolase [unclassified Rhodococcus (in: high G+C Gram-positive bacteria)]
MAAAVAVTLSLAGCGGVDPLLESGAARDSAPTTEASTAPADGSDAASPITTVTDTMLGWITAPDPTALDPAAIDALAAPELAEALAQVGGLVGPVAQIISSGPITVGERSENGLESTVALTTGRGAPLTLRLRATETGLLSGIQALPDASTVTSFAAADTALGSLGARTSYVASRVTDGRCTPVHALNADESLPLASISKLYVLGALARAVGNGSVSWDEQLTVTDARKSAPSGQLQFAPEGTPVTVREAAEAMIAISDNTATDLIIDRIGRDAVEAEVSTMGHADPAALTPFPTTREFFLLGWGLPDLREQWRGADTQTRRDILASIETRTIDSQPVDAATADLDYEGIVTRPGTPDGVEWFGSANDICRAYAALTVGPQSDVVRQILALNPGAEVDPARWPYVGYKNGNAAGDVSGSWLLTDASGQDWVVATQLASDETVGPLDNAYAFAVVQGTFELLR